MPTTDKNTNLYNIGQLVFNKSRLPVAGDSSTRQYMTTLQPTLVDAYKNEAAGANVQQLVLKLPTGTSFQYGHSYYLRVAIPKDIVYDLNFSCRAIQYGTSTSVKVTQEQNYEFLKFLHVEHLGGSGNTGTSRVILYQPLDSSGGVGNPEYFPVQVAIAQNADNFDENHQYPVDDTVWYKTITTDDGYITTTDYQFFFPKYVWQNSKNGQNLNYKTYLPNNSDGIYVPRKYTAATTRTWDADNQPFMGKNDALMSHTWNLQQTENKDNYDVFDIVFSPQISDSSFNAIHFYMASITEDSDITWNDGGDTIRYGRHIDMDFYRTKNEPQYKSQNIDANNLNSMIQLYEINDLFSTNGITGVKRIGVWGHPNQLMEINGEEIRIGPSNYYELKDFDINSFGMVCTSEADQFTVDYQYVVS